MFFLFFENELFMGKTRIINKYFSTFKVKFQKIETHDYVSSKWHEDYRVN